MEYGRIGVTWIWLLVRASKGRVFPEMNDTGGTIDDGRDEDFSGG